MTAGKGGFVLRCGVMFHGRRSGTAVAASEAAKVWSCRLDAVEQMHSLNAQPSCLPPWTLEPVKAESLGRA